MTLFFLIVLFFPWGEEWRRLVRFAPGIDSSKPTGGVGPKKNRSWHVSFYLFSHELTLQASISHAVSRWAVSSAHSIRRHLQTCPTATWTMSHYPFARATHNSLPRRPPNSPLRTSFPFSSRMRTSMGTVTLRIWDRGILPCQDQPRRPDCTSHSVACSGRPLAQAGQCGPPRVHHQIPCYPVPAGEHATFRHTAGNH